MDADESNRMLAKNLGLETPDTIANYLGGRKALRDEIKEHEKIKVSDLPEEYLSKSDSGIIFSAVGKIEEFGEGCACPYGFLSKELLNRIELGENEFLIVDAEAGIEHFTLDLSKFSHNTPYSFEAWLTVFFIKRLSKGACHINIEFNCSFQKFFICFRHSFTSLLSFLKNNWKTMKKLSFIR